MHVDRKCVKRQQENTSIDMVSMTLLSGDTESDKNLTGGLTIPHSTKKYIRSRSFPYTCHPYTYHPYTCHDKVTVEALVTVIDLSLCPVSEVLHQTPGIIS